MSPVEVVHFIRRRKWILASFIALGGAASLLYSLILPPQYESSVRLFVSAPQAANASDLTQGSIFSLQAVKSYADVATTPIVLDRVISELRLRESAATLATAVEATAPEDTSVLNITVSDRSPRRAAEIANAISSALSDVVGTLTPAEASSQVKITEVQSAVAATKPSNPSAVTLVAIGIAAGLVVGTLAGLLSAALDNKVRSEDDLRRVTTKPVIGTIAFNPYNSTSPLVIGSGVDSPNAEAYRSLRTNLQFLDLEEGSRVYVITSAVASEGKSTTAANLAIAVAEAGRRVLLIEADLRRPKVVDYLGLDSTAGLTDILIGSLSVREATQQWGEHRLDVLPAGQLPPNPSELLQSERMKTLLTAMRHDYDVIFIDAPPLLAVTDGTILANYASGALVVCALGRARRADLAIALERIEQVGARTLGCVLTMAPLRGPDAYGYRMGYYHSVS